jgi:hypothetical protein
MHGRASGFLRWRDSTTGGIKLRIVIIDPEITQISKALADECPFQFVMPKFARVRHKLCSIFLDAGVESITFAGERPPLRCS